MVSVKERVDKLIEELKAISKRAFGMALSVHKDPALRTQLTGEAHLLEDRLLDVAKELKNIDPASHKQWFFPVSEAILDLNFVLADSGTTSLRLGDIIHWGTRPGR